MADKLYPNSYNMYNRAPCAKQTPDCAQYYPTYNNFNQIEGAFNLLSPQTYKNQNVCMYPESLSWPEEQLKIPDMIEITSKDLSPASFCSNLDLLLPDFYGKNKELGYYNNGLQKMDFPSCAQSSQGGSQDTTVRYCSIQKDCGEYNYNEPYYYNGFDSNPKLMTESSYFELPFGIDQQTEGSNDESDIIVEESDEEIFEVNQVPSETNKCVVCNVNYRPLGTQFYFLTDSNPLTMSSQKPVLNKIENLVGTVYNKIKYLCSECLGLLNTIDHLQFKLENFQNELCTKFQRTCLDNNLRFDNTNLKKCTTKFREKSVKRMRCKKCRKVLCLKYLCYLHSKSHKSSYLCELCGSVSKTRKHFRLHYRKHQPGIPKVSAFACSNCRKRFRTKSNLSEHQNFCLGLLPYLCKCCDKKFPTPTKLKNHIKLKHDKKFIAICSICNIGFVKVSDYKSHKISHSTDKKYQCKECDKAYKTISNLNFHMKVHAKKMPFICSICGRGFMRKDYLEVHLNNHNGVKNFSCTICEKKFVSQKNLDAHVKYHDGSIKTNTCNLCGKVMTTGFEEHLRVHNNLKEFECDQCDCRFNTKGTLAKHKTRKHKNEL